MICPYCGEDGNFKNKNLTHKHLHKKCKNYIKKCPICDTIYAKKNPYNLDNCVEVDNLFEIDTCIKCERAWLPDSPTSWIRSVTNINKLYEVMDDINSNNQKKITPDNLYDIQRGHGGVIYNRKRAEIRGNEDYIEGSGKRRMSEYINHLKNMGFLKIKSYQKYGKLYHEFTKLGDEFINSTEPEDIITFLIIGYLNIKLNNGYQTKRINSNYQFFKIRFAHNLLKAINYVEENYKSGASKYQIGLSFLARNKVQFKEKTLKEIDRFSSNQIKDRYFIKEDELNRAVVSTFINPFITLNILKEKDGLYCLTDLGKNLLEILNNRPAIWYEDIEEYSINNDLKTNELFAKLILWCLIKNSYIKEEEVSISTTNIEEAIENLTSKNIEKIKDIHLNL
jgi:predicted transcriptional regulator